MHRDRNIDPSTIVGTVDPSKVHTPRPAARPAARRPVKRMVDTGEALLPVEDIKIDDVKALFAGMTQAPLISASPDTGNPGLKLVSNNDSLLEMLKIVYVDDYETARNIAEALAECDEFLLDEEGIPDPQVLQRIEWIKYMLALFCSVKGRFADAYKQASTGVLTNAMTEKGWNLLGLPIGGKQNKEQRENRKRA